MQRTKEEQLRDLYLRDLLVGKRQGPLTGKPSKDKPHLKFYPEEALMQSFPQKTMYQYLYDLNKDDLDDIALVFDTGFDETKITYRQLFENIDTVAKSLQKLGIKKNDKVAISFANVPESAYTIYALNKIGAIACLIDPRIKAYNLEKDLEDLDVKTFIGISESYKNLKKAENNLHLENIIITPTIRSATKKLPKTIYLTANLLKGNQPLSLNRNWSQFIAKGKRKALSVEAVPFEQEKVAIISYTGGTTGVHKGVELSNEAMNTLIFAHDYLMDAIKRREVFMNILPQFMVYGIFTLHLALCRGLETHMLLDSSPTNFVKHLIDLNPTMVFGGPIHWETLIGNPSIHKGCFSNLKAPVSGGEKLSLAKEQAINKELKKGSSQEFMCNGYGATELCGSVSLKYGKRNKDGTIGRLHVFDNAKIVDPETKRELSYHEPGELWITTPSIMKGYYHRKEETEKVLAYEDGKKWFISGDLGEIDENGDILLTGRSKRLFVCGLNNVYPPQMEELIYTLPNVDKCVVVPVPDQELREVPKVHLVLNQDDEKAREEAISSVQSVISEKIGDEVLPHYYEFHEQLKYTPNGKIDIEAIRKDDLQKMQLGQMSKQLIKSK